MQETARQARFPDWQRLSYTVFVLSLFAALPSCIHSGERLSQVKKVYVDSFGAGKGAATMRSQIVHRLRDSGSFEIVSDLQHADAVIKGTGQTWTTGYVSLSPRSPSVRSPVYQGFLSVQVVGKNDEPLWSYMVTPRRFSWTSVPNDLANQLANKLIGALKEQHDETAVAPADSKAQGTLKGAGATFPAPLYQQWFQLFQEHHPDAHINYEAVGSGEGIRRLQAGEIDFGASDMPVPDESMRQHQHLIQLPTVLGAVVPIYNVAGLHDPLKFTPEILAGIYLGQIRKWNDPQVRRSNPDANLPDANIVVVHRSDGSGTTFVWTDYLSKVNPQWKSAVGSGVTVQWPTGIGAEHSDGVAAKVQNTPNSIGYVELIYAIQHELSFGAVRNSAGHFVRADIASVTAAATATSVDPRPDLRVSITDPPGTDVYPIASYTWMLLPEHQEDPGKRTLLPEVLRWMLTSGQKSCSALGYVPLPAAVVKRALEALDAAN
jgi:phosphate ABC transporter phosphate-binding protein